MMVTYFITLFLMFVVLVMGGVLGYVFKDQVGQIFSPGFGQKCWSETTFVDFNLEAPPFCQTALSFLPNFSQPKQNWADSGTPKMHVNKHMEHPVLLSIYVVGMFTYV